jgi:hypothetical protein
MAELTTLRVFDNYVTAHIVKSRLESEGIPAFLVNEHTIAMQWVWANALGGIQLQVAEQDFAKAGAILDQIELDAAQEQETPGFTDEDTEQLDPGNKLCIYCGSRNTKKQDYEKKPVFLSWLLLGFPLLFRSERWHCFHCGKSF